MTNSNDDQLLIERLTIVKRQLDELYQTAEVLKWLIVPQTLLGGGSPS